MTDADGAAGAMQAADAENVASSVVDQFSAGSGAFPHNDEVSCRAAS
jgi:hypothetical protein